jgi:hypothetical protein
VCRERRAAIELQLGQTRAPDVQTRSIDDTSFTDAHHFKERCPKVVQTSATDCGPAASWRDIEAATPVLGLDFTRF